MLVLIIWLVLVNGYGIYFFVNRVYDIVEGFDIIILVNLCV